MDIQELLSEKAELTFALKRIPYDGSIEIKTVSDRQYLYIRRRIGHKTTSTYIDKYSDELYTRLLRQTKEARELKKKIRSVEKQLASLGYTETELAPRVLLNVDLARAHVKDLIYAQVMLAGIPTTFAQMETILENGKVYGMTATDVQKVLNLKHAWEFVLDRYVIAVPSDLSLLCHIAKYVNEGFYGYGGKIRGVPVTITGTHYVPPLPIEADIQDQLRTIQGQDIPYVDMAIELCLYVMKNQIFNDGNIRTSIMYANHYLIGKGEGLIVVPAQHVSEFRHMLINYYEGRDEENMKHFIKAFCHRKF